MGIKEKYTRGFNFKKAGFKTERTYNNDFKPINNKSGVYLIVNRIFENDILNYEVLYVGSSKNIKQRTERHQTLRVLNNFYDDLVIYFKNCENYLTLEKKIIKLTDAKFNIQWR